MVRHKIANCQPQSRLFTWHRLLPPNGCPNKSFMFDLNNRHLGINIDGRWFQSSALKYSQQFMMTGTILNQPLCTYRRLNRTYPNFRLTTIWAGYVLWQISKGQNNPTVFCSWIAYLVLTTKKCLHCMARCNKSIIIWWHERHWKLNFSLTTWLIQYNMFYLVEYWAKTKEFDEVLII